MKKQIAIIMGSDSDLPIMVKGTQVLDSFEVPYEIHILSAHRTPSLVAKFSKTAKERGVKVIIAGAGGAAHLAGVVASMTNIPVIGVPIESGALLGMDALLSTVQMPPGIPVATVGVNGAVNGSLLALEILALANEQINEKLEAYRANMAAVVIEKTNKLQEMSPESYIESYVK